MPRFDGLPGSGAQPATIKIENTQRYREVLWLGDLDSNQD
jgi:hypothetical protein